MSFGSGLKGGVDDVGHGLDPSGQLGMIAFCGAPDLVCHRHGSTSSTPPRSNFGVLVEEAGYNFALPSIA